MQIVGKLVLDESRCRADCASSRHSHRRVILLNGRVRIAAAVTSLFRRDHAGPFLFHHVLRRALNDVSAATDARRTLRG